MDRKNDMGEALLARYRKSIWRPFMSAVKEYRLISAGDRIAVCVSGGKDSALLALCMRELRRRSPFDFELRFICMDPGYAPENRAQIEELRSTQAEAAASEFREAMNELGYDDREAVEFFRCICRQAGKMNTKDAG